MGLLLETPGKKVSNLLIITNSGFIFSYIIRYSEQLEKLNYFISGTKSNGNETPEISAINMVTEENLDGISEMEIELAGTEAYYRYFSSRLLKSNQKIDRVKKRNWN